ncbi:MAG: type II and III secretion system protein family protein [Alphaproteobacteria bacterium]|nr:type II and III secretion system protein family protein [Alphaproteobacteria bacterium]
MVSSPSQPVTVTAGIGVLLRLPQPAGTVMSANPGVARVQPTSPTSLFLTGVAPGRTTVLVTSDNGAPVIQYDVTVVSNEPQAAAIPPPAPPPAGRGGALLPSILDLTDGTKPGAGPVSAATAAAAQTAVVRSVMGAGSVKVRPNGNGIAVSGTVPNAAAAETVIAIVRAHVADSVPMLDSLVVLGSIQVNVRVRIAEISRQVTRQLGFNWQALGAVGNRWSIGMLTGAAASGTINPRTPLGLAPLASAAASQFGVGYTSGRWDVNGIIDALASDQLVSILAEPNLTAQSGETASFLAGGEFPIPIAAAGAAGSTSITVEFKQFGVSLAVVPTVLSPTRLNLRVRPEVSQLSSNGAVNVPIAGGGTLTIPALTVRRAETTVELGSGQSFAIAGLLQRTSTQVSNALPGIGELPVVGALFKSNDFQRGESELVIIVTPYLVKPAPSPDALRLPTDGFKPATDLDRILLGRQAAPGPNGTPLDAGFILK